MTKNKHPKRKLAMKMMTQPEVRNNVSPFSCLAWLKRYNARRRKELAKNKK